MMPDDIYALFRDQTERLEKKIDAGFTKLETKLETHAAEDKIIERDVWLLKTERDLLKQQAMSRSTWIALLVSAPTGLVGIYTLWKLWH